MDDFKLYLLRQGISQRTVKRTLSYATKIIHACPKLNEREFDRFVVSLMDMGHSKASVNKYIQAVKHYSKFKGLEWADHLRGLKEDKPTIKTLTLKQIEDLCEIETNSWSQIYWKLLSYTGARPSEILNLRLSDINLAQATLRIEKTKTCHGRVVPITDSLIEPLSDYLSTINDQLFTISYTSVAKDFKNRCRKLEINGYTPYSLRHSFVTRILSARVPLFVVQLIVGHKKASTTENYFHANSEMLKEAILRDPLTTNKANPKTKLKQIEELVDLLLEDDERFDKAKIHEAKAKLHESLKSSID